MITTDLSITRLKDTTQMLFQSIIFIHKEKGMIAKELKTLAAPVRYGKEDCNDNGRQGHASTRKACLKDAEYLFI